MPWGHVRPQGFPCLSHGPYRLPRLSSPACVSRPRDSLRSERQRQGIVPHKCPANRKCSASASVRTTSGGVTEIPPTATFTGFPGSQDGRWAEPPVLVHCSLSGKTPALVKCWSLTYACTSLAEFGSGKTHNQATWFHFEFTTSGCKQD